MLFLWCVATIWLPAPASAHALLVRSTPLDGSIQATGPTAVSLWFSEHLDAVQSTAEVYDASRTRYDSATVTIDHADPAHMIVPLKHLPDGTYTVAWRTVSLDDGHTVEGTFTFRVGHARFPGAAPTENQSPALPAVGLRWLGILGLAATAGWFLMGVLGAAGDGRRTRLALVGAGVALLADLALVPVLAYLPALALPPETIGATLATMPSGWTARVVLEVLLLVAVAWSVRLHLTRAGHVAGLILVALAVLTLTLTSHAAARTTAELPAMVTNALHVDTVVFWIGGLLQLAVSATLRRSGEPVRRFSRLATALAPIALVTGALNAGVTLPSLASLWQSTYGRVLLVKSLLVVVVLGLAWFNRQRVRTGLQRMRRFAFSLRGEAVFAVGTILAASLLAFTAPPVPSSRQPLQLRASAAGNRAIHLVVNPPDVGNDLVQAWLTNADDQPVAGVDAVQFSFSMLEQPVDLPVMTATPGADGRWSLPSAPLTVQGWWSADVQVTGRTIQPAETTFYFLVPDPTLAGATQEPPTDQRALDVFKGAIKRITELKSMRTVEALSDGVGNSVVTNYTFVAPDKLQYTTAAGDESISIGSVQYDRHTGSDWTRQTRDQPASFPAALPGYYSGATAIVLGRTQVVDGEPCQIITFAVPALAGERDEARYAWWVGVNSHLVRREAMVARYHYMLTRYLDQDAPLQILPPTSASH